MKTSKAKHPSKIASAPSRDQEGAKEARYPRTIRSQEMPTPYQLASLAALLAQNSPDKTKKQLCEEALDLCGEATLAIFREDECARKEKERSDQAVREWQEEEESAPPLKREEFCARVWPKIKSSATRASHLRAYIRYTLTERLKREGGDNPRRPSDEEVNDRFAKWPPTGLDEFSTECYEIQEWFEKVHKPQSKALAAKVRWAKESAKPKAAEKPKKGLES